MTRTEVVREVRARLDREDPGWRAKLRRDMKAEHPRGGWVAAAKVRTDDGREVEVAILAQPSEVPPGPLNEGPMMAS
jgi:hypothetical protein